MLSSESLEVQNTINFLYKQDKKMDDALDKVLKKYSTDKTSVEEIVFFHKVMWNRASSSLSFRLRLWANEVDLTKAKDLFEKSLDELMQFKPKGFPLKRVRKLVAQIDELELIARENKKKFWQNYCVPVLEKRDQNEIMNLTHRLTGEGMYVLRSALYDAKFYLEENDQEEYNKYLKRTYF